jgi:ribonuclease HI
LKLAHGGAPAPQRKRAEPAPESPSADSAKVYAYTDGACLGNPGPGGWGVVIAFNGAEQELSGGEALTTNNRMELTAAIEALRVTAGQHSGTAVIITTDSQYVKNGIMQWIAGWKRNGWKTADKKEVKNKDLWIKLDELNALLRPEWKWVKGHSGHYYNERCDELAVAAARYYKENGR